MHNTEEKATAGSDKEKGLVLEYLAISAYGVGRSWAWARGFSAVGAAAGMSDWGGAVVGSTAPAATERVRQWAAGSLSLSISIRAPQGYAVVGQSRNILHGAKSVALTTPLAPLRK